MTTELTKAAQQALEALKLCYAVVEYPANGTSRQDKAIAALERALTQRPAAQEGDEEEFIPTNDFLGGHQCGLEWAACLVEYYAPRTGVWFYDDRNDLAAAIRKGPPDMPAPQQAKHDQFADASKMVPPVALRSVHLTRDTAGMCVVRVNGRVAIRDNGDIIDHTATLEWFADTQQATPEPDDDDKWRDVALRFDKHRMQALWHLQAMLQDPAKHADIVRQFLKDPTHPAVATPDPVGEPVGTVECYQIRGEDVVLGYLPRPLPVGTKLYTRPAPGVPEGFAMVPVEPTPKVAMVLYEGARNCFSPKVAEVLWQDVLAAAQAKGDQP